jgi:hypothetical protein
MQNFREAVEEESEFYSQFRCPTGKWIQKYGFTEETMKVMIERAEFLKFSTTNLFSFPTPIIEKSKVFGHFPEGDGIV